MHAAKHTSTPSPLIHTSTHMPFPTHTPTNTRAHAHNTHTLTHTHALPHTHTQEPEDEEYCDDEIGLVEEKRSSPTDCVLNVVEYTHTLERDGEGLCNLQ